MVSVIDTTGLTDTTNDVGTRASGWKILTKSNSILTKVTKYNTVTATRALLYASDGTTLLDTQTFSGNDAIFNYVLSGNTSYYILCDNNGASYTARYVLTSAFPFNGTIIDITSGAYTPTVITDNTNAIWNVDSITTTVTLNDGLEALYHFTGDYTDSSGNGNDAVNGGSIFTADKNSISNQAIQLDDAADYVTTTNSLVATNPFSISFWTNSVAAEYLFGYYDGTNQFILCMDKFLPTTNRFGLYCDGAFKSFSTLPIYNQWVHCVVVFDGTLAHLYVNGVKDATTIACTTPTLSNFDGLRGLKSQYQAGSKRDEFRMYSRVITEDEVLQLYKGYDTDSDLIEGTQTIGNEAYYKLDGDALDATGNGNNGTVNGAIITSSGKINDAYSFDGVNDTIGCNFKPSSGSNPFTINCWIYVSALGASGTGIMGSATNGSRDGVLMIVSSSGILQYNTYQNNGAIGIIVGTTTLNLNTWYMVTFTYDGTKSEQFINTSNDGSDTTATFASHDNNLSIGEYLIGLGSRYFDGTIDEVGVWNRVLTTSEIIELYNLGAGLQYPFTSASTVKKNALLLGGLL